MSTIGASESKKGSSDYWTNESNTFQRVILKPWTLGQGPEHKYTRLKQLGGWLGTIGFALISGFGIGHAIVGAVTAYKKHNYEILSKKELQEKQPTAEQVTVVVASAFSSPPLTPDATDLSPKGSTTLEPELPGWTNGMKETILQANPSLQEDKMEQSKLSPDPDGLPKLSLIQLMNSEIVKQVYDHLPSNVRLDFLAKVCVAGQQVGFKEGEEGSEGYGKGSQLISEAVELYAIHLSIDPLKASITTSGYFDSSKVLKDLIQRVVKFMQREDDLSDLTRSVNFAFQVWVDAEKITST